jgi:hypothetical protein
MRCESRHIYRLPSHLATAAPPSTGALNFPILFGIWALNRISIARGEGTITLSKNFLDQLPSTVRRMTTEHEGMLQKVFERQVTPEGCRVPSMDTPTTAPETPSPAELESAPFVPEATMLSKFAGMGSDRLSKVLGRNMGTGGRHRRPGTKATKEQEGGEEATSPSAEGQKYEADGIDYASLESRIASIEEVREITSVWISLC